MTHFMVDLETFGVRPDAAIVQIGAVRFDPDVVRSSDATIRFNYRRNVCLASSLLAGATVDEATVSWWRARPLALRDLVPIETALRELAAWLDSFPTPTVVWSNGAAFDVPILESAFRASSVPVPWRYSDVRDVRTVVAVAREFGFEKPRAETAHDALADAAAQVAWVHGALAAIRAGRKSW
jgi:exodeoxyribonuclease VIII